MIDTFFTSKNKINAKTILKLENSIKRECLKYKSKTTKNKPI